MEERTIKDISNLLTQLFQKMHDAGYEWDAEHKQLKKIEQKHSDWSEEDESMLQNVLECLKNGWRILPTDILKYESWLKSLNSQNRWKPTERMLEALKWAKCEFHPDCPETMEQLKYLYQELKQIYYDRT